MKLEQIRALIDAATPGPWRWRPFGAREMLVADHGRRDIILCDVWTRNERGVLVPSTSEMPNMALLAAARTLLPLMCDVVEAAEAIFDSRNALVDTTECATLAARLAALEAAPDA